MPATDLHFPTIQKLRAVAALAVVLYHLPIRLERLGYEGHWSGSLTAGVDLFFVISGFIMWVTTAGKPVAPGAFLRKRLIRIVPLYWLLTMFVVAVGVVAPSLTLSMEPQWGLVLKSLLFIPTPNSGMQGELMPVLPPGWTLELELPFYALMALALCLPAKARLPALLAALSGAAIAHGLFAPKTVLGFLTNDMVLEFGFGLLIGAFVTSGVRLPAWAGLVLIVTGVAASILLLDWTQTDLFRALVNGLPMAIIVLGAVVCDRAGLAIRGAWLGLLGDASYSLYLTHGLFLSAILQVWRRLLPQAALWNWVAFSVVATLASALVSLLVYRLVERPLGAWVTQAVGNVHLAAIRRSREAVP